MRFTEHEMVFFNSITKGNDVFGIPLKFRTQKGHEEEVKKTINGLIEKGVLASETELTKMGFFPARALECYKESRNHIIINYLHIALLEQREAIVIIPLKNREYEMLRLPRVAVLYLLLKIYPVLQTGTVSEKELLQLQDIDSFLREVIGSKTLSDAEVKKIGDVLDEGLDINFVSEDLNNILKNKGVTLEEFNALRLRDVSTLSEEERVMLRKIGEQLTEDERLKLIGKSTWDKIVNSISSEDRKKIQGWKFTPSDELYIKYKEIYDNPKYYNQKTGEIHWPPNDGFKEGSKCKKVIPTDTLFKRYGANNGEFLGNSVDSFESRALAPHSEGAEIHYYQLVEDYEFTTGKAAPWFGSEGGAQQYVVYKPDGSKYTIKELEETGIIEDVTELANKGEIVIE